LHARVPSARGQRRVNHLKQPLSPPPHANTHLAKTRKPSNKTQALSSRDLPVRHRNPSPGAYGPLHTCASAPDDVTQLSYCMVASLIQKQVRDAGQRACALRSCAGPCRHAWHSACPHHAPYMHPDKPTTRRGQGRAAGPVLVLHSLSLPSRPGFQPDAQQQPSSTMQLKQKLKGQHVHKSILWRG
jgi:hypothetical protein